MPAITTPQVGSILCISNLNIFQSNIQSNITIINICTQQAAVARLI